MQSLQYGQWSAPLGFRWTRRSAGPKTHRTTCPCQLPPSPRLSLQAAESPTALGSSNATLLNASKANVSSVLSVKSNSTAGAALSHVPRTLTLPTCATRLSSQKSLCAVALGKIAGFPSEDYIWGVPKIAWAVVCDLLLGRHVTAFEHVFCGTGDRGAVTRVAVELSRVGSLRQQARDCRPAAVHSLSVRSSDPPKHQIARPTCGAAAFAHICQAKRIPPPAVWSTNSGS